MENRARVIRSLAFCEAHDEDLIMKAAESGVDALGMDMEDLTPRSGKQKARDIFRDIAKELDSRGIVVMARANRFAFGCEADLEAIVCPELHCVNISKTESADDVIEFCRLLDKAEANNGLPVGYTLVRPVIETAAGIKWAYEIAAASDRITYMGGVAGGFWGDLGGTLGLIQSPTGVESLFLRSKVLVDVRTAGRKFPIGGGMTSRRDMEGVRAFAVENKHLGYTGAYTMPQKQIVDIVNEVFTPTPEEIADWQETIPLLEQAERDGNVAFRIGGRTYDIAGLERVRDQMELAQRLGLLDN